MPVTSVTEGQEQDASGQFVDVYQISFTVPNRPGSFNISVPKTGDPVAAAKAAIDAETSQVDAIYGL
jgi:hypothetical protein